MPTEAHLEVELVLSLHPQVVRQRMPLLKSGLHPVEKGTHRH